MQSGPHSNVTAALSELERKLADLERELGADPAATAPVAAPRPVPAPGADPAGPGPTAPPEPRVDELRAEIADLVRIRNQLESAARELVAEYDRLVSRLQGMETAAAARDAPAPAPSQGEAPAS